MKCEWPHCDNEAEYTLSYVYEYKGRGKGYLCTIHSFNQGIKGIVEERKELTTNQGDV